MLDELSARLRDAADDDSVRAVLVTGTGRTFCSGGDLTGGDTRGAAEAANRAVQAITALPKPVMAGVHGRLRMSTGVGLRSGVAAPSASFQLVFTGVGLMPAGGAGALLPGLIGRARPERMASTAKSRRRNGIQQQMIYFLTSPDDYDPILEWVVRAVADGPTMSYGWTKRALAAATLGALESVQAIEAEGQLELVATSDFTKAPGPSGNDGPRSFVADDQWIRMITKKLGVDGLDIEYADTGTGPTILFVHGVYVTGAFWNDVVAELGAGFRCIVPTWPLGAHDTPTDGADLGAEAASQRIVHFLEALDLTDVTVVANDTGGGLVLATSGDPTRHISDRPPGAHQLR